jgi:hypothetical protein
VINFEHRRVAPARHDHPGTPTRHRHEIADYPATEWAMAPNGGRCGHRTAPSDR